MADHVIAQNEIGAHEITLVANVVETFTFAADVETVEILSHDGAAPIYVTLDGSAPAVKGPSSFVLPAAMGSSVLQPRTSGRTVVRLISTGNPVVSVMRADLS